MRKHSYQISCWNIAHSPRSLQDFAKLIRSETNLSKITMLSIVITILLSATFWMFTLINGHMNRVWFVCVFYSYPVQYFLYEHKDVMGMNSPSRPEPLQTCLTSFWSRNAGLDFRAGWWGSWHVFYAYRNILRSSLITIRMTNTRDWLRSCLYRTIAATGIRSHRCICALKSCHNRFSVYHCIAKLSRMAYRLDLILSANKSHE